MRPRLAVRRMSLGLALGLAVLVTVSVRSVTVPAPINAQTNPLTYVLRDTWRGRDFPVTYQRLPWPAGHVAGGIAHDPRSGQIFVTDMTAGGIHLYDAARLPAGTIGGPGTAVGVLAAPRDVAVLDGAGDLIVSEPAAGRMQIVGQDGTPRSAFGALGDPQGVVAAQAADPHGVAAYVVDRGRRELVGIDAQAQVRLAVPLAGGLPFVAPEGLALQVPFGGGVTPQVSLAVADPGLGEARLVRVLPGGGATSGPLLAAVEGVRAVAQAWQVRAATSVVLRTLVGGPGFGIAWAEAPSARRVTVPFADVRDIEIAATGEVFATVDPDGPIALGTLGSLVDQLTWPAGRLTEPSRIAAGDGLAIADAAPRMQWWDRSGTPLERLLSPSGLPLMDVAASGSRRYALVADSAGTAATVWAADGGQFSLSWRPPADASRQPVAMSASGDRAAVLDLLGQEVWMLDAELREVGRWSVSPAGRFDGVLDLALGGRRVFVTNQQAGELEVWTDAGALVKTVSIPTGPLRVAAGPGDRAFVLTGSKWVFAYGPDGDPLGAWPAGQPSDRPVDLAVDADGILYVVDAGGEVRVYARDAAAPSQLPPAFGPGRCAAVRDKGAAPPEIQLGETVEVQLVVDGVCPVDHKKADVVLTIDKSGSMREDNKMAAARQAATAFLAQTDPLITRIALVSFDVAAAVNQTLTSDRRLLIEQVNALAPSGGTHLVNALNTSIDVLTGPDARPDVSKVIVYMSDGRHTELGAIPIANPPGMAEAIDRARAAGIRIYSIGLGTDVDVDNLKRMASDDASYFFSPTAGELRDIYVHIARRIESSELFKTAVVTDRVPRNMTFLPGTGRPTEPEVSADQKTLTWRLSGVLEPGFRLSYRLRPQEPGYWPTNVEALTDFVDGFGNSGRIVFPVPRVRVLAPTPVPMAHRIYLPFLVRQTCDAYRVHITLLVDTSSSMGGALGRGGTAKIDAARSAVKTFVNGTDLRRDVVSIARFDSTASIVAMGSDGAALRAAADGLVLHEGTRIDLGLAAVRAHLGGPGKLAGARSVVVLLSDGTPSEGTTGAARAEARALASAGVTMYTMAVGEDADRVFLAELAGSPGRAYYAGDPAALVRLYAAVAEGLDPCTRPWHD